MTFKPKQPVDCHRVPSSPNHMMVYTCTTSPRGGSDRKNLTYDEEHAAADEEHEEHEEHEDEDDDDVHQRHFHLYLHQRHFYHHSEHRVMSDDEDHDDADEASSSSMVALDVTTQLEAQEVPNIIMTDDQVKSTLDSSPEQHLRSWIGRLYLHPKAAFCWVLSLSIWALFVTALSFGLHFMRRAVDGSHDQSVKTTYPSIKKSIQLIGLSFSSSTGLVACIAFSLSPAFRKFAFPGVMQLCWSHLILDLVRLIQLVLHFSYIYPQYCLYIHFLYQFFQPASILWLAAICVNLLFSMKASPIVSGRALSQNRKNWTNIVMWMYCIINACTMTAPYMASGQDKDGQSEPNSIKFGSVKTSGVCIGEYGILYSYITLPLVVLGFVLITTIAFRKKMNALYPKKASQRIQHRTNLYLLAYMASWSIVMPGFIIMISRKYQNTPEFWKIVSFSVYDNQGFLYALITLREFAYYHNRHDGDGTLHLHQVDIADVDFGEEAVILGEGTFAVVFKGRWKTKAVAVKVFKLREVDREKMKMEAYLASKLTHPHLLLTYGCSVVDDDNIAIITEWMPGGTLDDVIFGPKLSYPWVLQYALMIARGCEFLHVQGVCHRDLKPSNCLLNAHRTLIKVADFGCSRWILGDSRRVSLVPSNTVATIGSTKTLVDYTRTMTSNVGTPCWTAPELMTESKMTQYSVKVDVYSFSIILWQLYTGKMPYAHINGSLLALEEAVIAGKRPSIPSQCPELLRNLMVYGWDANPVRRPNFSEIVRLLEMEVKCTEAMNHPKIFHK